MSGLTLSEQFAKRVGNVVKRIERTPVANTGNTRRTAYEPGTPRSMLRGKLNATLNKDGSADMTVWYFDGTSEVASTETVKVYDWMLSTGQTIASGKKVAATFDPVSSRYYVTSAECG